MSNLVECRINIVKLFFIWKYYIVSPRLGSNINNVPNFRIAINIVRIIYGVIFCYKALITALSHVLIIWNNIFSNTIAYEIIL